MKKIVSLILAFCLMVLFAYNAFGIDTALNIGNVSGKPGDVVNIPVDIIGNSGFAAFDIVLEYDKSVLELTDLKIGEVIKSALCAPNKSSDIFSVINLNDIIDDGTLFVAEFKIKENAKSGIYNVSVNGNLFNTNTKALNYSLIPGAVTVSNQSFIKGDINRDATVSNKDVIALFRCVSANETETYMDLDGDGTVGNRDVLKLFKYVSKLISNL